MTPRAAPAPRIDATRPAAIERWLPGVGALRTYQRAWLPQDLMAGLPAIYGLYTTVVGLLETSDRRHFFPTLEVAAAAVERAGLDVEPPREVPEPA